MKEIQNKTSRPIRIKLPRGKVLHLGPSQIAQIAAGALEHPDLQKLVEEGVIEVLGEGQHESHSHAEGPAREETHGNVKAPWRDRGDR